MYETPKCTKMDQQNPIPPTYEQLFPPSIEKLHPTNLFLHADVLELFEKIKNDPVKVARLFFVLVEYATKGIFPEFDLTNPADAVVAVLFDQSKPYSDRDTLLYRAKVHGKVLNPNSRKHKNPQFYKQRENVKAYANELAINANFQNASQRNKELKTELLKRENERIENVLTADEKAERERKLRADAKSGINGEIVARFVEHLQDGNKILRDNPQLLHVDTLRCLEYAVAHNYDRNELKRNRIGRLIYRYSQNPAFTKKLKHLRPLERIDFFELLKKYTEQAEQEQKQYAEKFAQIAIYGYLPVDKHAKPKR